MLRSPGETGRINNADRQVMGYRKVIKLFAIIIRRQLVPDTLYIGVDINCLFIAAHFRYFEFSLRFNRVFGIDI